MARAGNQGVISGIVTVACFLLIAASLPAAPLGVSIDDVVLLAQSGITDETILVFLDYREIGFEFGSQEILSLREAGVGEQIIRYLIERTGPPLAAGPAGSDYYPPRDDPYPSRYYATAYGAGAGYYLGASTLPGWWWYDSHYLYRHGIYPGQHHRLAGHGLFGHSSIVRSATHLAGHVTGGLRSVLGHHGGGYDAGHRTGGGHRSAVGHGSSPNRFSVGHRGSSHASSSRHSSGGHNRSSRHVGGSRGSHGSRSHSSGGHRGSSHGGGSHGGGH